VNPWLTVAMLAVALIAGFTAAVVLLGDRITRR
jgi:hypothetical protein